MRIEEVIDNLVSNAIKYSPHNKKISIFVRHITGDHNQKFVQFEVKDEGPGLSEQDKTKVFGSFQRLSARPTGGESSTGLGLSIVKQLVELHDGKIWVDSKQGSGSSFSFILQSEEEKVRD
jgi:signal transduction histidine kinase